MGKGEPVIGKDYVELTIGGMSQYGATAEEDKGVFHIARLFDQVTLCGAPFGDIFTISSRVRITCPKCIDICREKAGLPKLNRAVE